MTLTVTTKLYLKQMWQRAPELKIPLYTAPLPIKLVRQYKDLSEVQNWHQLGDDTLKG